MELDRYLKEVLRRWYLLVIFTLAGLAGTWGYFQWSGGGSWGDFRWGASPSANVSVAVLEPAVTNGGQQANVTFASVVESHAAAERAVQKLGWSIDPSEIQKGISVKLARTLVPSVPTPLYVIEVTDPDGDRALAIANAIVDASRDLFIELNSLDPQAVNTAFQTEETRLRNQLADAQAALHDFEERNQAWQLPSLLNNQLALVTDLRKTASLTKVQDARNEAIKQDLEASLASEEAQLRRLRSLQPAYERLALDVSLASSALAQLTGRETGLVLDGGEASLEERIAAAEQQLETAQQELIKFEEANKVSSLPAEIASQIGLINQLKQVDQMGQGDVKDQLANAEQELIRLRGLQPEYERLALDVAVASGAVAQLTGRQTDLVINGDLKALESQINAAKERLDQAQSALTAFERQNGVSNLPDELSAQLAVVTDLNRQTLAMATPDIGFDEIVAQEEAELERLRSLQPDYERLTAQVGQLSGELAQLQARKFDTIIQGTLLPAVQVKTLDGAKLESSLLWTIIFYLLGAMLGIFASLVATYLLAYFDRTPRTAEDIQEALGAPVLVRVPKAG